MGVFIMVLNNPRLIKAFEGVPWPAYVLHQMSLFSLLPFHTCPNFLELMDNP
jgi:hypothetical protein